MHTHTHARTHTDSHTHTHTHTHTPVAYQGNETEDYTSTDDKIYHLRSNEASYTYLNAKSDSKSSHIPPVATVNHK